MNIGDTFAVDNVFFQSFVSQPNLIFQYVGTAQEQDRQMCRFLSTTTTDYFCGEPGDVEDWLNDSKMWPSTGWGQEILLQEFSGVSESSVWSDDLDSLEPEDLAHVLAILTTWQAADTTAERLENDPFTLTEAIDDYEHMSYGPTQESLQFLAINGGLSSGQCWALIKEIIGRID
jgi:hypothetical protein